MQPELQEAIEKARTAALAANLLTVELVALLEELRDIKNDLTCELSAVRDQRIAEHGEWREFMAEQYRELDRISADFRTDATLFHLFEPPKAGASDGTEKETRGSTQRPNTKARWSASDGSSAVRAGL